MVQPPAVVVPPVAEKRPGMVAVEADLKPAQVQDLTDQMGELARVAVGYEVRMRFRIEVGGAKPLPPELLARLNDILGESLRIYPVQRPSNKDLRRKAPDFF